MINMFINAHFNFVLFLIASNQETFKRIFFSLMILTFGDKIYYFIFNFLPFPRLYVKTQTQEESKQSVSIFNFSP